MRTRYSVAIAGATGLVGETLARILGERNFPVGKLAAFATQRSSGRRIDVLDVSAPVTSIDLESRAAESKILNALADCDVAFFAAGEAASKKFAQLLAARGTLVIDKSAAFRLDPNVPLVVPEVNIDTAGDKTLIANPNCSTIPLAVVLGPIQAAFGLEWVSVATYQSVSGAGKDALQEFERQQNGDPKVSSLPRRIAGNVFPHIGSFDHDGDAEEERKIADELRKILRQADLRVSATTVRVPVAVGHSEAVSFQTKAAASRTELAKLLATARGIRFQDGSEYVSPLEAAGSDDIFVGRLRADRAHPGAYLAWVVCDNLRKGAATNAVQIAESLLPSRTRVSA